MTYQCSSYRFEILLTEELGTKILEAEQRTPMLTSRFYFSYFRSCILRVLGQLDSYLTKWREGEREVAKNFNLEIYQDTSEL
jgi:hypothetical protein